MPSLGIVALHWQEAMRCDAVMDSPEPWISTPMTTNTKTKLVSYFRSHSILKRECIHYHGLFYRDKPQGAGMRTPADGFTPYSGTQSARGPRQAYEHASQATNPMIPAKHMHRLAPMITQIQEKRPGIPPSFPSFRKTAHRYKCNPALLPTFPREHLSTSENITL